jgi:hypothetical protein
LVRGLTGEASRPLREEIEACVERDNTKPERRGEQGKVRLVRGLTGEASPSVQIYRLDLVCRWGHRSVWFTVIVTGQVYAHRDPLIHNDESHLLSNSQVGHDEEKSTWSR